MIRTISICYRLFPRALLGLALAAVLIAAAGGPTSSLAQGVMRIAAVVNDEVISAYDLNQRVLMVMVTGRIPDTDENRRRLTEQVLRNMIDEQLQLQEAKRLNIRVSDEEIGKLLVKLNAQNKLPPGTIESVLVRAGVDINALKGKLRADEAWTKLIRERLQQQVFISDEEVDEELKRLKAVQHLPRLRVAEIFLPVDNLDTEKQVYELADRLMQQIRAGADFAALAREFSQSASAAVGGDLGWVTKGQLAPEVDRVLADTGERQVAGPVQTLAGYYILLVIDRVVPSAQSNNVLLDYTQLVLPVAQGGDGQQEEQLAQQIRAEVQSCDDLRTVAARTNAAKSGNVNGAKLADLPAAFRDRLGELEIGETTEPLRTADGVFIAALCARTGDGAGALPTRAQIQNRLGNDRFNLLIQRYMRDLRQTAFVDIRG
jgi:peptidyl-prolyl cis-trans isomerase SurA